MSVIKHRSKLQNGARSNYAPVYLPAFADTTANYITLFPVLFLPNASATCCPTTSNKERFEVTCASVRTVSAGVLQRCTRRNCWRPGLQSVQNGAVRLQPEARRLDHITSMMRDLRWLPMERRIVFKTAVLAWNVSMACIQKLCVSVENVQGRPFLRPVCREDLSLPG